MKEESVNYTSLAKRVWTRPELIREVVPQTPELCAIAVCRDPSCLRFVQEQTEELCWSAIKQNACVIDCVNNPTEGMLVFAVKKADYILSLIEKPSRLVRLESVKAYGSSLSHIEVEERDEETCIEAVRNNPKAIQHVPHLTARIVVEALVERERNFLLQYFDGMCIPAEALEACLEFGLNVKSDDDSDRGRCI